MKIPGTKVYICSRCSDSYYEKFGEPLGLKHDWYPFTIFPATCTFWGSFGMKCYNCGVRKGDEIDLDAPPLGHDLEYEVVVEKEPTCTENGYGYRQCKRLYNGSRCPYTEEVTIAKIGHDLGDLFDLRDTGVEKQATCTEDGVAYRQCKREGCDYKVNWIIPKTGHNYEKVKTVEPTCTKVGYNQYKCSICGHTYNKSISKLGHDFSELIETKAPTRNTTGYKKYKCSRCPETKIIGLTAEEKLDYFKTNEDKQEQLPKTTKKEPLNSKAKDNKTNIFIN